MSVPKDVPGLADLDSKLQPETGGTSKAAPVGASATSSTRSASPSTDGQFSYATRFTNEHYHPVILIGSSAAGKTVLLLSLLAYFKDGTNARRLNVVFGDDMFRAVERNLQSVSKRYFDQSVAKYIRGTTETATAIDTPMFIPAKVYGESQAFLKFAFMESSGETYQPDESPGKEYFPAFHEQLETLLTQYTDGMSFIWVVPHVPPTAPRARSTAERPYDPAWLRQQARESLEAAFKNYTTHRSGNSERDTHMLLVTKWDTYEARTLANNIRTKLDRANDEAISQEVETFLEETYSGVYGAFEALKSPPGNKVVFRYSAGSFNDRDKYNRDIEDLLRTYPRDVWNWLYEGMKRGHTWDMDAGTLIPPPPRKTLTPAEIWHRLVSSIIG